jgi:hypothetical protein
MPELSRFYGIIITMYYLDHPPPHFHVRYNEHRAKVSIAGLAIIDGELPSRVMALVAEWGRAHRQELMDDWNLAVARKPVVKIAPLD